MGLFDKIKDTGGKLSSLKDAGIEKVKSTLKDFENALPIIKKAGYKSLSTTVRGKMTEEQRDTFFLKRHHLIANWNKNYLNYFFCKLTLYFLPKFPIGNPLTFKFPS